jgi:hypothetical protein
MKHFIYSLAIVIAVLFTVSIFSCQKSCSGTCQNGGTCKDGSCSCPNGYSGAQCQTAANAQFVGNYIGNFDVNSPYTLPVKASLTNPIGITIDPGSGYLLNATISGSSINIPLQTTLDTVTWSGTGSLSSDGNTITISFNESYAGSSQTDIFTGTK